MNHRSRAWPISFVLGLCVTIGAAAAAGGSDSIAAQDLREWLTYIASDELQGRAVFGTGIGLAAGYIQDHLKSWGVKPGGDHGSYLQTVRVLGVKSANRSTVTVDVAGETRTFTNGEGITFQANVGGKRRFGVTRVEFAGYGLDAPAAHHQDYADSADPAGPRGVRGAAVVWLGSAGPKGLNGQIYRRLLNGRSRYATEQLQAAAAIGPQMPRPATGAGRGGVPAGQSDERETSPSGRQPVPLPDRSPVATPDQPFAPPIDQPPSGRGGAGFRAPIPVPDFTTAQRLDRDIPPTLTAGDAFFEFLFGHAPTPYAELERLAKAQEPLPRFTLEGVTLTFNIDAEYEVVRTELAQNVVAIVDGSDPQLKNTYVAFGAHYDHVGYAEGEVVQGPNGPRRLGAPGRVSEGAMADRIWNGADDDGSGTVALMALAKAFSTGPRPKRSLLFVWHTGEERGLLGSRYFADNPTVPIDRIVAQLNMDMIGRNRDDKPTEANTVYIVGSDRISTELHEINRAANASLARPLSLDYEMNDPADLEQVYYRSDHYSYAAKGIPVIFFTTGLHADYHANTDEVSKIEFDKMARVAQLVYETGARVANLDHPPARDNKGPRTGKSTTTTADGRIK
jgi:hypothetical protein